MTSPTPHKMDSMQPGAYQPPVYQPPPQPVPFQPAPPQPAPLQPRYIYVQPRRKEGSGSGGAVIAAIAIVFLVVTLFIIGFTAPSSTPEPTPTYTTTIVTTSEPAYWDEGAYIFLGILFILPIIIIGVAAVSFDETPSRSFVYQNLYMRPYDMNDPDYCNDPRYRNGSYQPQCY